mmetsp:Transcript_10155/g.25456  ORF Transcript_10155/g.25456 Transcript_10155/m.25456 type:complete len:369 (+) Transcript_10155:658-1764(+)
MRHSQSILLNAPLILALHLEIAPVGLHIARRHHAAVDLELINMHVAECQQVNVQVGHRPEGIVVALGLWRDVRVVVVVVFSTVKVRIVLVVCAAIVLVGSIVPNHRRRGRRRRRRRRLRAGHVEQVDAARRPRRSYDFRADIIDFQLRLRLQYSRHHRCAQCSSRRRFLAFAAVIVLVCVPSPRNFDARGIGVDAGTRVGPRPLGVIGVYCAESQPELNAGRREVTCVSAVVAGRSDGNNALLECILHRAVQKVSAPCQVGLAVGPDLVVRAPRIDADEPRHHELPERFVEAAVVDGLPLLCRHGRHEHDGRVAGVIVGVQLHGLGNPVEELLFRALSVVAIHPHAYELDTLGEADLLTHKHRSHVSP